VALVSDPYRLHSEGSPIPVGTFVAASIEGSTAVNVMRVPRGMVRGSDELILVDDDNKLRFRSVNIVRSDADYVYINDGVVAGERVVATALESPVNGSLVRIVGDTDSTEVASSEGEK
jgi:hypothetical protein